jgi:erythromycin esterase-like protein
MLFGQKKMDRFVSWARDNAVVFAPSEETKVNLEKLSSLDAALKGKRIVFLGEEDHWIHEKYEYRCLMLEYLFSRGWRYVGEELGWSDGMRLDRYLATGESTCLERIATYGYRGDIRPDREDKASGILNNITGRYPLQEFKAEQIRFAKFLRSFNETLSAGISRVHFFGFDVNAAAGGGYKDIEDLLNHELYLYEFAKARQLLLPLPGESVKQEIQRLDYLLNEVEDSAGRLKEAIGQKRFAQLKQCILTIRDSLRYHLMADSADSYKDLNKAMAFREEMMCRYVEYVLAQMKPEEKLVLMGHNRHLCKDSGKIKKPGASPPGGRIVPSLGTYLSRRWPDQVFSIWMVHEYGKSSHPFKNLSSEYTTKRGSFNSALAQAGDRYLLHTAVADREADLLHSDLDVVGLYNITFRAAIAKQADAVFFVRKVTPLSL